MTRGRLRALESLKESHGFRSFRRGGEDGLLVGLQDAKPAVEILRVIGARRVGDAQIGTQEGCAEFRTICAGSAFIWRMSGGTFVIRRRSFQKRKWEKAP